jgi:hypothetical protein
LAADKGISCWKLSEKLTTFTVCGDFASAAALANQRLGAARVTTGILENVELEDGTLIFAFFPTSSNIPATPCGF